MSDEPKLSALLGGFGRPFGPIHPNQQTLSFESPVLDGENVRLKIKKILIEDIRDQDLSRPQIAEKLTELSRKRVTHTMVDAWTSGTKDHRFPADLIGLWVRITKSTRLLEFIAAGAGYWVGDRTDRDLAEFARASLRVESFQRQQRDLKRKLAG